MTTRTQRCPVCTDDLDNHSNLDFILCEMEIRKSERVTLPAPSTPVKGVLHDSWTWTLPERWQG